MIHLEPINNVESGDQLLSLLTLVEPNELEKEQIVQAINRVCNWNRWYEVASFNKIVPMCYYSLLQLNLKHLLPEPIFFKMEAEAMEVKKANELRNKEAAIFLKEFQKNNIAVALLKGVAFGEVVYKNPSYKRMNDIDLLVKKENIDAIYAIYNTLGYFYFGERISGSKEKSDKITHLSPPYVNKDFTCVIGTQWGIKTPLGSFRINYEKLWSRMSLAHFMGIDMPVLSPEDNLHHLCLHMGYFKISVRDVMDLYNLIRVFRNKFDWNLFCEIVDESHSHNSVYFGLKLSQFLCPMAEVQTFIRRIENKVSTRYKRAVAWKTRSMDVFLNLHSDHIQTIEKELAVFNCTSYFPEKIYFFFNLWKFILWPSESEVIHMSALYKPTFIQIVNARMAMPYKILRAIASEIGWYLVFLLIIKINIELFGSLFKLPFNSREKCDMEAYSKKNGLPLQKLVELKAQFQ